MSSIPIFLGVFQPTQIDILEGMAGWSVKQTFRHPSICIQSFSQRANVNDVIAYHQDHVNMVCCVADAYIANRRELFSRLSLSFKTREDFTDSELILQAYLQWGINCVNQLMGDFVFAICDKRCDQFFLARSPISQRNIFYYQTKEGTLYFSNTVKLLLAQKNIPRRINQDKVAAFLTLRINSQTDATFYRGIFKIPSAHYLTCSLKQILLKRYWSANAVRANPLILPSREDYYASFRGLFETVVSDYISTSSQVVTHLSGGLDSSSVTSMAAYLLRSESRSVIALGHIPSHEKLASPRDGWNYSDKLFMHDVVNQFSNVTLQYVESTQQLFACSFRAWLDQPILNPITMIWMMGCVEQARIHGAYSILIGQSGNSTISWPASPFYNGPHLNMLWRMRYACASYKQACYQALQSSPWRRFSALNSRKMLVNRRKFNEEEKHRRLADYRSYAFNSGFSDYAATLFSAIRHLYGIDHLDPCRDRRIVEFCLRIPHSVFVEAGRGRLLVREGLKGIVPDSICNRATRGLQTADWAVRFEQQKSQFKTWLYAWRNTNIADYLDIPHLIHLLSRWDYARVECSKDRAYQYLVNQYRLKFLRGLEVGLFLEENRLC
ncbi:MAG TPA: asparagine synthase-related protein [Gammaproteobacteria bacterium]|nr:asparagine synthase-related protein [Gammaproteobacteria bacterium]